MALQRALGPLSLWGLGVGYVISGMYFGWNLGLPEGGTYGLLVATLLVTVMYVTFTLGYAELACALPRAGGGFTYAQRAFGPGVGFVAGVAQCIEFVFAPPAIAAAIGAYLHLFAPRVPALAFALGAYGVFTALNAYGVKQSAAFELGVAGLAVVELLIFAGVTAPRFSWAQFSTDALPHGWTGVIAAVPYAIWFYLGIEGLANVAEETAEPEKHLAPAFRRSLGTLVVLALLTFFSAVGVAGWRATVFAPGSATPSDSPLPLVLARIVGANDPLYHLLIGIGLCGLVASFHGIVLVAGRALYELGRVGSAPRALGTLSAARQTPTVALLANLVVGCIALATGRTGELITLSVLGALTLYAISAASVLRLRTKEPELTRPYRAPGHPVVPAIALTLAALSLVALAYYNRRVALVYAAIMALAALWFRLRISKRTADTAG